MATSANPTFEDVDKHVQGIDLTAFHPGGTHHPGAAKAAAGLPNICPSYKAVRPILLLVSTIPIIPQKWRDVIKLFLGVMDGICP